MAGCARYYGSAVNNRHHAVVNQLRLWCQDAGWHARAEVALDAQRRIDLLVDSHDKTTMVDVTVCSTKARSWEGYSEKEILERVTMAKTRSYGKFTSKIGESKVVLLTFFVDVWGSISPGAMDLLRELSMCSPEGPTANEMALKISSMVVTWTGKTAHAAGLLRAWDVDLGLSPFTTHGRGPNKAQAGATQNTRIAEEDTDTNNANGTNGTNGVDPSGAAAFAEVDTKDEPEDESMMKKQFKTPAEMKELEKKMFATAPSSRQVDVHGNVLPVLAVTSGTVRDESSLVSADACFPVSGGLLSDRLGRR